MPGWRDRWSGTSQVMRRSCSCKTLFQQAALKCQQDPTSRNYTSRPGVLQDPTVIDRGCGWSGAPRFLTRRLSWPLQAREVSMLQGACPLHQLEGPWQRDKSLSDHPISALRWLLHAFTKLSGGVGISRHAVLTQKPCPPVRSRLLGSSSTTRLASSEDALDESCSGGRRVVLCQATKLRLCSSYAY